MTTTTLALLVPADISADVKRINLDGDFRSVQTLVGGPFDCVRAKDYVGYVHDEGQIIGLPQNHLASYLFGCYLAGDVLIVGALNAAGRYDGDNHDVPAHLINMIFGEDEE